MIDTIDLDRHAVIEASAGTGKTYTINQLVLRLLRENRCGIESILLVTYTEKATGELKDRLRQSLEKAIDDEPAHAIVFQAALDQFDQAPIFTIHGFCQRVLTDHAGDLGQEFQAEQVDDNARMMDALREVERREWHHLFGEGLTEQLKAARFGRAGMSTWEAKVAEIAKAFRPDVGHRLIPDAHAPPGSLGEHESFRLAALTIERMREMLAQSKRERGQRSFDDMIREVDAGLDPDRNPRAEAVSDTLRRQYSHAIVDEFQDTDLLQWRIMRRLFLEAGSSRLFIVGDPKQAIYGFRGADLPTYFEAVHFMTTSWNAARYSLAINWRSSPDLIDGLNLLFEEGKFFPADSPLRYVSVEAPPAEKRRVSLAQDLSARPPLIVVDVNSEDRPKAKDARRIFARFGAGEIQRLLYGNQGRPLLTITAKGESRPLRASDICLLVFRRSEAQDFTSELRKLGIPYSFLKSERVTGTAEAKDIRHILQALAEPDEEGLFRRALLTKFFRIDPQEMLSNDALSAEHPARQLFREWVGFAGERRWAELFTSMLERSGLLFFERDSLEYDRRLANVRFLLGRLQQDAYRKNLDLFELIEIAEDVDTENDEDDTEPQETQAPRVRIMTIHASKGLEFPVVFLAGGFTESNKGNLKTYRDETGTRIFDLSLLMGESKKVSPLQEQWKNEANDELRRLLYVALTRGQFKVYVPYMTPKPRTGGSPLPALVTPALEASGLKRRPDLVCWGTPSEIALPFVKIDEIVDRDGEAAKPLLRVEPLFPPQDQQLRLRCVTLQSFTGLKRKKDREHAAAFGEWRERVDETQDVAAEPSDPFRGAAFGELVHEIYERIDFAHVKAAKTPEELDQGVTRQLLDVEIGRYLPKLTSRVPVELLREGCRRLVREILWNSLRAPLGPLGGPLCDLVPRDRLCELEFLFPDTTDVRPLAGSELFFTGFMDLVFRWRGRVYLLDWKTNALPSYGPDELARAMADSDYHLQYQLYMRALEKWLGRLYGDSFRKDRHLGGVFYLFVRGMNGRDDSAGVFFEKAV